MLLETERSREDVGKLGVVSNLNPSPWVLHDHIHPRVETSCRFALLLWAYTPLFCLASDAFRLRSVSCPASLLSLRETCALCRGLGWGLNPCTSEDPLFFQALLGVPTPESRALQGVPSSAAATRSFPTFRVVRGMNPLFLSYSSSHFCLQQQKMK